VDDAYSELFKSLTYEECRQFHIGATGDDPGPQEERENKRTTASGPGRDRSRLHQIEWCSPSQH
jgi:hypothetical protein